MIPQATMTIPSVYAVSGSIPTRSVAAILTDSQTPATIPTAVKTPCQVRRRPNIFVIFGSMPMLMERREINRVPAGARAHFGALILLQAACMDTGLSWLLSVSTEGAIFDRECLRRGTTN